MSATNPKMTDDQAERFAAHQNGRAIDAAGLAACGWGDGQADCGIPADEPARMLDKSNPLGMARAFAADNYAHPDGPALVRHAGEFWAFDGIAYAPLDEEAARCGGLQYLEGCQRTIKGKGEQPDQVVPFCPRQADVSQMLYVLPAVLPSMTTMPQWRDDEGDDRPDPADLILARNGHFDPLDPGPIKLFPPTPRLFAANPLTFDVDPDAPMPTRWLQFFGEAFDGDPQRIQLAQEWIGYCLTGDTGQHKALFCIGPKRSGKTTFCNVVRAVVGEANVTGPLLASLAGPFGLQPLLGKRLAIIPDARLSGRADSAAIAGNLLAVTGEDSPSVARKFKTAVEGKLPTRFILCSNEMPRLDDASGALAGRFLFLDFPNSHYDKEDHGLTGKLLAELPGILLWAVDGLRRLRDRGHFIQPVAGKERWRELEELSSPALAFVRECCEVKPGATVEVDDLFKAWQGWCGGQGREHPGDKASFGRYLSAAAPGIKRRQRRERGGVINYYEGIGLKGEGIADLSEYGL